MALFCSVRAVVVQIMVIDFRMSETSPHFSEVRAPFNEARPVDDDKNGVFKWKELHGGCKTPQDRPVMHQGATNRAGESRKMECQTVVERLRGQGWNLNWFSYTDRDGQMQWRACARNEGTGRSLTVQAVDLSAAVSGLEAVCIRISAAQSDPQ